MPSGALPARTWWGDGVRLGAAAASVGAAGAAAAEAEAALEAWGGCRGARASALRTTIAWSGTLSVPSGPSRGRVAFGPLSGDTVRQYRERTSLGCGVSGRLWYLCESPGLRAPQSCPAAC